MEHHHHHDHAVNHNRAFAVGVGLNMAFVVIEAGYGVAAGSLALIADAGHNLSDVVSLLLAWGASALASRSASHRRTYGYRKATILASLVSSVLLFIALGAIAREALGRLLLSNAAIEGNTVITVALIGVVINTVTALLFMSGQHRDLNVRAAFLHMVADAAVSLGVVIGGLLIRYFGWLWVDPVLSLAIVAVIFVGTWSLLRDSIDLTMDAAPRGIDVQAVRDFLARRDGVASVHDLHVWALSTTENALTAHLVMHQPVTDNRFVRETAHALHDEFDIDHATLQLEYGNSEDCLGERPQCA
ncbi:MAG: cation transporter [Gammaproteobacteria bacterium]|nr:cation transporter [Gammaproteobacteria bacterium]